jgi:hypothetical protein
MQQLLIAAGVGGDGDGGQALAMAAERHGDVEVLVGVDAGHDRVTRALWHSACDCLPR